MTRVIDAFDGTRRLLPGRVRELSALQAERQRSAVGELRVVLVLGEAGLGKTRLAAEVHQHGATLSYQVTHRLTREVIYTGGGARRREPPSIMTAPHGNTS